MSVKKEKKTITDLINSKNIKTAPVPSVIILAKMVCIVQWQPPVSLLRLPSRCSMRASGIKANSFLGRLEPLLHAPFLIVCARVGGRVVTPESLGCWCNARRKPCVLCTPSSGKAFAARVALAGGDSSSASSGLRVGHATVACMSSIASQRDAHSAHAGATTCLTLDFVQQIRALLPQRGPPSENFPGPLRYAFPIGGGFLTTTVSGGTTCKPSPSQSCAPFRMWSLHCGNCPATWLVSVAQSARRESAQSKAVAGLRRGIKTFELEEQVRWAVRPAHVAGQALLSHTFKTHTVPYHADTHCPRQDKRFTPRTQSNLHTTRL